MINFSKSRSTSDLQNKSDVQYKVICDWLRTIVNNQIQMKSRITSLEKGLRLLLEDESPPAIEERQELDHSSNPTI